MTWIAVRALGVSAAPHATFEELYARVVQALAISCSGGGAVAGGSYTASPASDGVALEVSLPAGTHSSTESANPLASCVVTGAPGLGFRVLLPNTPVVLVGSFGSSMSVEHFAASTPAGTLSTLDGTAHFTIAADFDVPSQPAASVYSGHFPVTVVYS